MVISYEFVLFVYRPICSLIDEHTDFSKEIKKEIAQEVVRKVRENNTFNFEEVKKITLNTLEDIDQDQDEKLRKIRFKNMLDPLFPNKTKREK